MLKEKSKDKCLFQDPGLIPRVLFLFWHLPGRKTRNLRHLAARKTRNLRHLAARQVSFCGKFPGPEADAQGLLCSEVLRDDAFTAESGYQRDTFACFAGRRGTLCSIPGPFVPLLAVEVPTDCPETIDAGQFCRVCGSAWDNLRDFACNCPEALL